MSILSFTNRQSHQRPIRVQMPFSFHSSPVPSEMVISDMPRAEVTDLGQALSLLEEAQRVIGTQAEQIHRLEKNVVADELTGLANRRSFMLSLRRELGRTRRNQKAAGMLIIIDLDDFKQVNDAYGRAVGDNYLQTLASVLINEVRSCDYIARIGGDEFAVLMPEMNHKAAAKRFEKLDKIINARVLHHCQRSIPLRASLGFTMLEEDKTPENLLIEADLSLYASKAKKK